MKFSIEYMFLCPLSIPVSLSKKLFPFKFHALELINDPNKEERVGRSLGYNEEAGLNLKPWTHLRLSYGSHCSLFLESRVTTNTEYLRINSFMDTSYNLEF
jgi:hypothetical protein